MSRIRAWARFSLDSQAYKSDSSENTLQISDTQILNDKVINETRFQLLRDFSSQTPATITPQVQVSGNETFGGDSDQIITDHSLHYELQNLTEIALKTHAINFGGRLRVDRDANTSNSSFNGIFTFGGTGSALPAIPHACQYPSAARSTVIPFTVWALVKHGSRFRPRRRTQPVESDLRQSQNRRTWQTSACTIRTTGERARTLPSAMEYAGSPREASPTRMTGRPVSALHGRWESPTSQPKRSSAAATVSSTIAFLDEVLAGDSSECECRFSAAGSRHSKPHLLLTPMASLPPISQCSQTGSTSSKTAVYQIAPNLHAAAIEQAAIGVERQVTKSLHCFPHLSQFAGSASVHHA